MFEVAMNKDPSGLGSILVDMFAFAQVIPNRRKQQCPKTEGLLYFPLHVVPTAYKVIDGIKNMTTNLPWYLNNTSCINDGFVVMSNGARKMKAAIADDSAKYQVHHVLLRSWLWGSQERH
jgi:hypothetical protein